jgi:ribosome maturation protein SDO1
LEVDVSCSLLSVFDDSLSPLTASGVSVLSDANMPDMLVRLKKGKTTFEVLTKDGQVTKYRDKLVRSLDEVLVSDDVWTNVSKGQKASKDQLLAAFETDDEKAILEQILQKGEQQLSANERKDMLEHKRAEIVAFIHKNFVDPAKNTPIPLTRIENALEQVRPRIDMDEPADRQVTRMMAKLVTVLPLRKGNSSITGVVSVPQKFLGATSGVVRKHGTVIAETFGSDGAKWTVEVHSYDALVRDLARVTKGEYQFSVAGADDAVADGAPSGSRQAQGGTGGAGGKGKKKGHGK